ncbi:MAG: hypothetical protein AAFQ79_02440 [Pseudomonadota bacterium]
MTLSEALAHVHEAQKKYDQMLYAYNQLEKNDGLGSKSVTAFSDRVAEADNELFAAKQRLAETRSTNAEDLLRKVAVLVDPDNDTLFVHIKAEIEALFSAATDQPSSVENAEASRVSWCSDTLAKLTAYDLFLLQERMRDLCDDTTVSALMTDLAYGMHLEAWKALVTREHVSTDEALTAVIAMFNDGEFEGIMYGKQLQERCLALIEKLAADARDARIAAYKERAAQAA